jgi:hypothetical protein
MRFSRVLAGLLAAPTVLAGFHRHTARQGRNRPFRNESSPALAASAAGDIPRCLTNSGGLSAAPANGLRRNTTLSLVPLATSADIEIPMYFHVIATSQTVEGGWLSVCKYESSSTPVPSPAGQIALTFRSRSGRNSRRTVQSYTTKFLWDWIQLQLDSQRNDSNG